MKRKWMLMINLTYLESTTAFLTRTSSPNNVPSSFSFPHHASIKQPGLGDYDDKDDADNDDNDEIPLQNISDEEALLACRAFLQRRNKLNGWKMYKTRKQKLHNALALGNNRTLNDVGGGKLDESIGYFWEDPTELKYMRTGRPRLYFDRGISVDDDLMVESFGGESDSDDDNSKDYFLYYNDKNEDDPDIEEEISDAALMDEEDDPDGMFTGFPTSPPPDFSSRSLSKKRLFRNPEWKQRWYEARWGNLKKEREARKRKKRIEKFIQQIPSDILTSPQLDSLTDDEIEGAIKTYIMANRKRSHAQKQRILYRKKLLQKSPMERFGTVGRMMDMQQEGTDCSNLDLFLSYLDGKNATSSTTFSLVEEARRKRSERARKAYRTRMKNASGKSNQSIQQLKRNDVNVNVNKDIKVESSLKRIRKALQKQKYPLIRDIEVILEPKRMPGRKSLLQAILLQCFGLRGKCIPNSNISKYEELKNFYSTCDPQSIQEMEKKFVTTSSIHELGYFICYNLRLVVVEK